MCRFCCFLLLVLGSLAIRNSEGWCAGFLSFLACRPGILSCLFLTCSFMACRSLTVLVSQLLLFLHSRAFCRIERKKYMFVCRSCLQIVPVCRYMCKNRVTFTVRMWCESVVLQKRRLWGLRFGNPLHSAALYVSNGCA